MNRDFYDKKWGEWDNMIKYSPAPRHRRRMILKMIRRHLPPRTGLSFHDIGCGNSVLLLEIKRKINHLQLSGSDVSTAVIENNKKKYTDITFYPFDIGKEIDHPPQYDMITCSEVLEHVENIDAALQNLDRFLKPEGILILTVPRGKIYPIDKLVGHYRHFLDMSLFDEMFEVKECIKWGFPFFNLYKWVINLYPEKTLKGFNSNKYGTSKKLIASFINFLFYLNLPAWGNQMVLVLKKRTTKDQCKPTSTN